MARAGRLASSRSHRRAPWARSSRPRTATPRSTPRGSRGGPRARPRWAPRRMFDVSPPRRSGPRLDRAQCEEECVARRVPSRTTRSRPSNRTVARSATRPSSAAGGLRLFLAAILDLFSRYVVGWSVGLVNDRHLVLRALDQAIRRRDRDAGLMWHSDQGGPGLERRKVRSKAMQRRARTPRSRRLRSGPRSSEDRGRSSWCSSVGRQPPATRSLCRWSPPSNESSH